jgi:hypothetical protein
MANLCIRIRDWRTSKNKEQLVSERSEQTISLMRTISRYLTLFTTLFVLCMLFHFPSSLFLWTQKLTFTKYIRDYIIHYVDHILKAQNWSGEPQETVKDYIQVIKAADLKDFNHNSNRNKKHDDAHREHERVLVSSVSTDVSPSASVSVSAEVAFEELNLTEGVKTSFTAITVELEDT